MPLGARIATFSLLLSAVAGALCPFPQPTAGQPGSDAAIKTLGLDEYLALFTGMGSLARFAPQTRWEAKTVFGSFYEIWKAHGQCGPVDVISFSAILYDQARISDSLRAFPASSGSFDEKLRKAHLALKAQILSRLTGVEWNKLGREGWTLCRLQPTHHGRMAAMFSRFVARRKNPHLWKEPIVGGSTKCPVSIFFMVFIRLATAELRASWNAQHRVADKELHNIMTRINMLHLHRAMAYGLATDYALLKSKFVETRCTN